MAWLHRRPREYVRDVTASAAITAARRILVLGPSGAGKTYLSVRLCQLLSLQHIELDALYWLGPTSRPAEREWHAQLSEYSGTGAWIMDGTYQASLKVRLPFADAVICVERSRLGCLWGVISRYVRSLVGSPADGAYVQAVNWSFLKYIWEYPRETLPYLEQCLETVAPETPVIVLQGPRDVGAFLKEVQARLCRCPTIRHGQWNSPEVLATLDPLNDLSDER
jgi:adenylate kinase family enzyme